MNQKRLRRFFDKIQSHFKNSGGLTGRRSPSGGSPSSHAPMTSARSTRDADAQGGWAMERPAAFDPVANENASREGLGSQVTITEDMYSALQNADALVVSTDWDEFKSPDFDRMR